MQEEPPTGTQRPHRHAPSPSHKESDHILTRLLAETIQPEDKILLLNNQIWSDLNRWLEATLRQTESDGSLSDRFSPFEPWQDQIVTVTADPCDQAEAFWKAAREGVQERFGKDAVRPRSHNPIPLFDVIVVTPLLLSANWRLGLARVLRVLKPGGRLLFCELRGDALLLDGRLAEWVLWNRKRSSTPKETKDNRWTRAMCRLFLQVETECNRPWIPEISLSHPAPLSKVLTLLGGQLKTPVVSSIHLTLLPESSSILSDLYSLCAYLSPVEISQQKTRFQGYDNGPDERKIEFLSHWHLISIPGTTTNSARLGNGKRFSGHAITDSITRGLLSNDRNLLDSPHYLLPTFERAESGCEARVLRSLRGFMCRMIQHDRFDPENHHLFIASLWEPGEADISRGQFAKATGLVFRCEFPVEGIPDEVLRQITYLAHSRWNASQVKARKISQPESSLSSFRPESITLQNIPEILFDSARPAMRVVIGDSWDFEFHLPKQLDIPDQGADNLDIGKGVIVPAQITITMPDYDAQGRKWKAFRQKYFEGETNVLDEPFYTESESLCLGDRLLREIWTIYEGKLFSFPWNISRGHLLSQIGGSKEQKLERGEAAALIMLRLADQFNQEGNILARSLGIEDPDETVGRGSEEYRNFTRGLKGMLTDLNIPRDKRKELMLDFGFGIFRALIALSLTLPMGKDKGDWELLQLPIGAFLHPDGETNSQKFVSAGSTMLVRRQIHSISLQHEDEDMRLRQTLGQIRSTQLIRLVPTVLLPLSSLLLVNRLNREHTKYQLRHSQAEAARGLLHNLRNLISPALSQTELLRSKFGDWFGNAQKEIDKWEAQPWWSEVGPTAQMFIEGWRDIFSSNVETSQILFAQRGASSRWVTRTLNAYYSYLSDTGPSIADLGEVVQVFHDTLSVAWETWINLPSWVPGDDIHLRPGISTEIWAQRKGKLNRIRTRAANVGQPASMKEAHGRWNVMDERVSIGWDSALSQRNIHYATILFHVLYELIWNGLKYMASQIVLFERETPSTMSIELTLREHKDEYLLIEYSQSCPDEKVRDELLQVLRNNGAFDSGKFRGLAGIPHMADRCNWLIRADKTDDDRLSVQIHLPLD